jgi:hypothetical protein
MLRNLRTNEESFIIQTPNVVVDFAEVHGNLVNGLESASHHNTMILLNVLAEFLALGIGGSGGARATGATQADLFMKALKYVANYVCDVVNMYLIPELVVWNYPTRSFPKLQVRNIGETRDLQMLGAALANLLANGGITMDLETENWIRDVFDMPDKSSTDASQVYTANGVAPNPVQGLLNGAGASSNNPTGKGDVSTGSGGSNGAGNVGAAPGSPI